MAEIFESTEHEISIGTSIIKQVVQNRGHYLDIIREALSNSCSKQVKASYFKITIFYDGKYGWSFIFEDDGIGMDYTGEKEPEKQGRLDRFLNLSYSGAEGLETDEFGFKGLGSKLMYLSRKLEIETKTISGKSYKVVVDNGYNKLIEKKKPEMPRPVIYKDNPIEDIEHGTIIRVSGYSGGSSFPEYRNFEKLKKYLQFRTLIGYTKPERLKEGFPKIILNTPDRRDEELNIGFPWIDKKGHHSESQKIGLIYPPIKIKEKNKMGDEITVILKGGYVLETSEFGLSGRNITSMGLGLSYSWKGIPYFNLDFNQYKPKNFELYYKFCRFVVECDEIDTDIARSRIVPDVRNKNIFFEKVLIKAYREVMNTADYKEWVTFRRELQKKKLGESLNKRKEALLSKNQKWVFYKNEIIHKKPKSENDTLAILWKLEALKAFPFYYFKTLEHTKQIGMDVIAEYQKKNFSEKKLFQAIEVEYILENYATHEHSPEQTSLIIAWDSKSPKKLTKIEKQEWNCEWEFLGKKLEVILLKYLPNVEVKLKES